MRGDGHTALAVDLGDGLRGGIAPTDGGMDAGGDHVIARSMNLFAHDTIGLPTQPRKTSGPSRRSRPDCGR